MESVKICHFKTLRAGNFAFRNFFCFFLHYIHVKKFVCEDISAEYQFESKKFKEGTHQINIEWFKPKWKHNGIQKITDAPKFTYILFYIFAMESVKLCRVKTFWMSIFARATFWLFRF